MATALNTIALDLGTTSIKAAVCNNLSQIQQVFSAPVPTINSDKGHYVSNAIEYLATVEQLLKQCQIICQPNPLLGLCYQRSSFVIWDSCSGIPVTKLISWQDNRGQSSCDELINFSPLIKQLSGLPLAAYYFAPKLRTLLQRQPELLAGIINKSLCVGTLDSFIIWHWTAGRHYLTDASMAARTLLMDIHKEQWSQQLTHIFSIPLAVLPTIKASTNFNLTLDNGAVLQVSLADQSSALLANVALENHIDTADVKTEILVNLGTGGFVVKLESKESKEDLDGYLRTLVYQEYQKHSITAIEGTINSITAVLQSTPYRSCRVEDLAYFPDLFCIAEPNGIGAPFFRSELGVMFSKSIDQLSQKQRVCCLLEAIVFRVALILEDFTDLPENTRIYLSGGLANLSCLQQGIANCSAAPVFRLLQKHASLQGTALLINNLAPETYRQAEEIAMVKHQPLFEKYQQWKIWFKDVVELN